MKKCGASELSSFENLFFCVLTERVKEVQVNVDGEGTPQERMLRTKRSLQKWKSFPNRASSFKRSKTKKWSKDNDADILHLNGNPLPKLAEEEEAVGIITMEDVIEELLQVRNVSTSVTKSKIKKSFFT